MTAFSDQKRLLLNIVILFFCLFITLSLSACTESQRKGLKHFQSDVIGLKRRVTLYDQNGKVVKAWEGRFKIEVIGGFISFIDDNGKDVKVSGTVVVEEL